MGEIPIFPLKVVFSLFYVKIHLSVPKLGSFGAPGFPEALERPSGQACGVLELSQVTNALATVPRGHQPPHAILLLHWRAKRTGDSGVFCWKCKGNANKIWHAKHARGNFDGVLLQLV